MGSGIEPLPIAPGILLDPAGVGLVANCTHSRAFREARELLTGPADLPVEALAVLALNPLLQLRVDIHRHLRIRVPDLAHDPLQVKAVGDQSDRDISAS